MIRSFVAIELKDQETIQKIKALSSRLRQNQSKIKIVEPENLHLTIKFLGNIPETLAPIIYGVIKELKDKYFHGKSFEYHLKGVGQFNKFSVIWIKLNGNIQLIQAIKDSIEEILHDKLKIERDKRPKFKPHLTIGRLNKKKINYKTFESFKRLLNENKDLDFGNFNISEIKLKKSVLTPSGPIYSDLVY